MSNKEILEKLILLQANNDKLHQLVSLSNQLFQNELKILKYELSNGLLIKQTTFNMDNYYSEIKCRVCNENKKVVKDSNQHKNSICRECNDEMLDDYESDNEIC
jgi:hypothetical protein